MKKKITVFLSAADLDEKYVVVAKELGRLMVKNGFELVFGGTNKGLMKVLAEEIQKNGGRVTAISVLFLKKSLKKDCDKIMVAKTLNQRKDLLLKKGAAIILLPGGVGSLDEIFHTLELKKHYFYTKPVVILNIDNFYQGLKTQMERMEKEGFLPRKLSRFVFFAKNPKEAVAYLKKELK